MPNGVGLGDMRILFPTPSQSRQRGGGNRAIARLEPKRSWLRVLQLSFYRKHFFKTALPSTAVALVIETTGLEF